jgi:hypothetical protein
MGLVTLMMNWWRARLRRIDLEILWPTCKREAPDLDHAKAIFAVHAFNDPAWVSLGQARLIEMIDELR